MEDDKKKIKAREQEAIYKQKINDLQEEGNDLTKTYTTYLSEALKKEGKLTKAIKERIDLAKQVSDIVESEQQPSEKVADLTKKMTEVEEQLAQQRKKNFKKSGGFAKGHTINVQKQLQKELEFLQVQKEKQEALKDVTDMQKMQAAKMFGVLERVTNFVKRIPGGGMFLEAIGFGEKNMKQIKKNMVQVAAGNMKFRDAFTKGMGGKGPGMAFLKALGVAAISALAIYGTLKMIFNVSKKIAALQDKLGESFGVAGVQSETLNKNMFDMNIAAVKLGYGMGDIVTATSSLADNFGIGFNEASKMSAQVLDSARGFGISVDESSKLYGILVGMKGFTEGQAKDLLDSTYRMAEMNNVNPSSVMADMAKSAETIAKFGRDNLESITEAAVQAKKMGLELSTVDGIAGSLLNFQESLNAEIEASIMIGRQINLQKARELALTGDLSAMMDEVINQLGSEEEFNKLNTLERQALAKALNTDVATMEKLVMAEKEGVVQGKSFAEVLGKDGLSALTTMTNEVKSLGAVFLKQVQPIVTDLVTRLKEWLEEGGMKKLEDMAKKVANIFISIVSNLDIMMGVLGTFFGAALGFMVGGPFGAILGGAIGGLGGFFGTRTFIGDMSNPTEGQSINVDYSAINEQVSGRALGGPVSSNTPYIVGEKGPELFIPNTSGNIQANNQVDTKSMNSFNQGAQAIRQEISLLRREMMTYFDTGGTMYRQSRDTNRKINDVSLIS
tara:strand:+ start:249 stop:2438 length:2190 start_codon:yes stop_codon:yes gene_type:complete